MRGLLVDARHRDSYLRGKAGLASSNFLGIRGFSLFPESTYLNITPILTNIIDFDSFYFLLLTASCDHCLPA